MKTFIILIFIFSIQILNSISAQSFLHQEKKLAFPGAEGFGKFTSGGRGGMVYIVTNLNDNGLGSLRWALEAEGPRIIVFEVSGNIQLNRPINIRDGNLTIAGQTAPGEGITIQNFPVRANKVSNVIIRFLRFRLGDLSQNEFDAFTARFGNNFIIDHCSFSWGTDETCSIYDMEETTVQNCIISEGLNYSIHSKGEHSFGSILGGENISYYKNLMAHFVLRNPSISGNSKIVDLRNNLIYNWSFRPTNNGGKSTANLVNNYYKPGPATKEASWEVAENFLFPTALKKEYPDGLGKFYLEGNVLEGKDISKNQWSAVRLPNTPLTESYLEYCKNKNTKGKEVAFPIPDGLYSKTWPAIEAYDEILKQVGASLFQDKVDERLIKEVMAGKVTFKGSKTGLLGIIDSQNDVGGWPELKSLAAPKDTDRDGMPDEWEIIHGLNPELRDDRFYDLDPNYTNLEVYLNSLVEHIIK